MNKIRPFILAVAVVISALLAYGVFTQPRPQSADSEGFSAERVVKDIEVISKEHHSVAHPEERAAVREYLVARLNDLGADTVRLFQYDSLVGPQNRHVEYTFDACNILADFGAPGDSLGVAPEMLLVAHYDSRYSQPFGRDTVWSYGAADDGYGVGVILECVSHLVKERPQWKQNLKVLFTDAEEVGMMGMKAMWENDREVFDNVGFVMNVEARGPKGPALLFEACPGNSKVMKLYKDAAKYPYTYSLTTVVYGFMPNFTDFTVIKDSIPGLNFSTIADVNHYHTHLDNFGNVNPKSIQHYGTQVLPVAQAYLTGEDYSDVDALKSDKDAVNFTVPGLGMLNFSKIGYTIFSVSVFVVFLLLLGLEGIRGRLSAPRVFRSSLVLLACSVAALLVGELVAWLACLASGVAFKPFGIVQGVMSDNVLMIVSMVLMAAACLTVYLSGRRSAARKSDSSIRTSALPKAVRDYALNVLYAVMAVMLLASAVLLGVIGENMMFLIPLFCATGGMVLYRLTGLRLWLLAAVVFVLLHAFSFYYALAMALTIGALGAVMMLAFFVVMLLIPLSDLYLMQPRKKA